MTNLTQNLGPQIDINKLKPAKELKGKIAEIFTEEEILQLAKDFALPHYVLINPVSKAEYYLFSPGEVQDWVYANCLRRNEPVVAESLTIYNFDTTLHKVGLDDTIPMELASVKNLFKLPLEILNTPPGVYFLCDEKDIVYVGQSINVANRIATHLSEAEKQFNQVYFIPCHISHLNHLESSMIRYFKPKYNQTCGVANIRDKSLFASLCTDAQAV